MEATINTYQCPACTGPLHFAAGSGKLECEYCGSSYEVAEVEAFYAKKNAPTEPELTCPRQISRLAITCYAHRWSLSFVRLTI